MGILILLNLEHKLHAQTESAVKRRDPNLQVLAQKYNNLVKQINGLIDEWKPPRNALHPIPIDTDNLFALDIDDDIWQDIGLLESDDGSTEPPPWLCDDDVRSGIKAMLEQDWCPEEESRLVVERRSLQEWFAEEWKIINIALDAASGRSMPTLFSIADFLH